MGDGSPGSSGLFAGAGGYRVEVRIEPLFLTTVQPWALRSLRELEGTRAKFRHSLGWVTAALGPPAALDLDIVVVGTTLVEQLELGTDQLIDKVDELRLATVVGSA